MSTKNTQEEEQCRRREPGIVRQGEQEDWIIGGGGKKSRRLGEETFFGVWCQGLGKKSGCVCVEVGRGNRKEGSHCSMQGSAGDRLALVGLVGLVGWSVPSVERWVLSGLSSLRRRRMHLGIIGEVQ